MKNQGNLKCVQNNKFIQTKNVNRISEKIFIFQAVSKNISAPIIQLTPSFIFFIDNPLSCIKSKQDVAYFKVP